MQRILALRSALPVIALVVAGCAGEPSPVAAPDDSGSLAARVPSGGAAQFYSPHWSIDNGWAAAVEVIDTATGLGTSLAIADGNLDGGYPDAFVTPYGLAFDHDGTAYTIVSWFDGDPEHSSARFGTIDVETGVMDLYGPRVPLNFAGPEVGPDGTVYATGFTVGDPATGGLPPYVWGDSNLYRVDKFTGEFHVIGDTGHTEWMDMAFDSHGRLWATFGNDLYTFDLETGASTFVTHVDGVPMTNVPGVCEVDWPYMEIMSIAFDDHDVLWATAMRGFSACDDNDAPLMWIDVATGQATVVGYTGQGYNHGGDIMPTRVDLCHRTARGGFVPMTVSMAALDAHRAHGDVVPGADYIGCGCPTGTDATRTLGDE